MSPRPRMSLSSRLCVTITTVVVVGMVAVSLPQQISRQNEVREALEHWVALAAAPIVESVVAGSAPDAVDDALEEFRLVAERTLGHAPTVRIETGSHWAPSSVRIAGRPNPIVIDIDSRLAGVPTRLVVEGEDFEVPGGWTAYWLHVLATVVLTSSTLYVILLLRIALPLERLLDSIRIMELGYWGEGESAGGVWEIRWLSQRFREMGVRLEKTVENLVQAERRGADEKQVDSGRMAAPRESRRADPDGSEIVDGHLLRRDLESRLQTLQALESESEEAKRLARLMWTHDPPWAEQLGEIDLKTRIEDAAFQVLDRAAFVELQARVDELAPKLIDRADFAESLLRPVLLDEGVSVIRIERRIKGLGSIWRKMERKGLSFSQVHDLLALRVVVGSTEDCYRALHSIHRQFSPIVGRFKDYIADPKGNGYQSIHSSVRMAASTVCEIQIRSLEMHRVAEAGDCAHWRYRAGEQVPERKVGESAG